MEIIGDASARSIYPLPDRILSRGVTKFHNDAAKSTRYSSRFSVVEKDEICDDLIKTFDIVV